MRTTKCALVLLAIGVLAAVAIGQAMMDPAGIRTEEAQYVLYTVHRGDRDSLAEAVTQLYALAERKGIETAEPLTLVALNDPFKSSEAHNLTEIRIRVTSEIKPHVGKLGPMTDVKLLPAHTVAWTRKEQGEPTARRAHRVLQDWTRRVQITPLYGPREILENRHDLAKYTEMEVDVVVEVLERSLPNGK